MVEPTVVVGDLPAIEAALAAEVQAWKARDPLAPPTILIGNSLLRPYLRRRLAHLAGGHLNLRLLTSNDLLRRLGEPGMVARGLKPLPWMADDILAESVAAEADGYLAPVAHTAGFARDLYRLFGELRQAMIGAADLRRADDAALNPEKHRALTSLYQAYEQRRAPFYSEVDCFSTLDPTRFDAPGLLVYGPWRLTPLQRHLLELLMEQVPVTIYLPRTETDADEAHQPLRDWLAQRGARITVTRTPRTGSATLAHLQAHLFHPSPGNAPHDGSVRLLSAPDPAREAREVARACLAWAAEGIAFHEMAVVYRHADPYRHLIDEVFREAAIPCYFHARRPLADQPLGRRLLALLDLVGSSAQRSAVMEFLTETPLPAVTRERYGEAVATWDALSREAGIVEGRDQWLDRLRLLGEMKRLDRPRDQDEPDERLRAELDEIERFSRLIRQFANRLNPAPGRASWAAHLAFLRELVADYIDGALPVVDALDRLSDLAALTPEVSFDRFRRAIRRALEEIDSARLFNEPQGSFGRQGVAVLDVYSLRHLRARAVAVLGLAERSFPTSPRQDALLLDRERRRLNDALGWDLPLRASGPDPEPLQFALAVQAAGERLLLSYPRSEAGGKNGRLPSHFFRAAAEALTGERIGAEAVDGLPATLYTRVPAARFGAPTLDLALTTEEHDRTLLVDDPALGTACLERQHEPFARGRRAWIARWQDPLLTVYDGVLTEGDQEVAARRAGLHRAISPSRLETYGTCPYRFFLQYLLRLEPVEEPELLERLGPLERGSLIHKILERFLDECGPDDPPRPERRVEHRTQLCAIAEEECAERERRGLTGYQLLWQFDRTTIIEELLHWYDLEIADQQAYGLQPGAFELRFGRAWTSDTGSPRSADEPFELSVNGQSLRFQGRVDRLDWNPEQSMFRVIDYKTGKPSSDHKDNQFRGGRALQLPIYLLAASQVLGIPWERSEAQYFYVSRRGGFKRIRVDGATLQQRWETFTGLLEDLAGSIAAGDFHPVPGDRGDNCRFCDYRTVCDARIQHLAARKAEAVQPAFQRIAEVE